MLILHNIAKNKGIICFIIGPSLPLDSLPTQKGASLKIKLEY